MIDDALKRFWVKYRIFKEILILNIKRKFKEMNINRNLPCYPRPDFLSHCKIILLGIIKLLSLIVF